jgi:serine/threonine protein phosphatase PrpC
MSTAVELRSGLATDTGPQRSRNEDRVFADDSTGVFLVVDGLGGHAAGELAAQTALDVIVRELTAAHGDPEQQIRHAITAANNEIFQASQQDPACAGMACVLTLAVARGETVTVGHVGDSRLYLIWNGTVRKLTSDHSPVGELEDQGELTEVEAMSHPRRNEVFRDVGSRRRTPGDGDFIEVKSFPFHPAAALLLSSDGLSDSLTSAEIAQIVETFNGDPGETAEALVQAANDRGGSDNVSVVFVAGPEFLGVHSPAMADARARHAITRMRHGRRRWKRRLGRVVWLAVGIVLGMLLLAAIERYASARRAGSFHHSSRQGGLSA